MKFIVRARPGEAAGIRLDEPETFTEFSVVADADLDDLELEAALDRLANSHTDGYAFIAPSTIREAAGPVAEQAAWNNGLVRMMAFAQSRGWVDGGGNVRAHVQRG